MIISEVVFALIGSILLKSAISASINYEPIKITVNENFNTKPGQVSTELRALEPGVLQHPDANFYFKPQLNLPQSFIPSHIEALISLIQQQNHSCAKDASKVVIEKDKLIEILQPFMYPLSENSKERLLENDLEKDNNLEIVKPPLIIEKIVPIIITEEPKPVTPELLVIPEAPMLPQFSLNDDSAFIKKQVKKEESVILEEPKGEYLTIPEIAVTAGLVNISDAPVLPSFSLNDIPPNVEVIRKEETAIVEGQKKVFPAIPEIALTPFQESIINNVEPELTTSDLLVIPEAPVLTPITVNDIKLIEDGVKIEESSVEKVVKNEESIIFEDTTEVFSTFPEIVVRPVQEPIINYVEPELTTSDLLVIPEAPVLPTLSANDIHVLEEVKIEEPIVVDAEPNPVIQKRVIPEAPILPPLSLKSIPYFFEEKLKNEESIIFDERTSVVPTIPDMVGKPIEEPFINYVEPKPIITEFQVIPEAPALPPLSANDIKLIEDGVKFNKPIVVDVDKPSIQEYIVIPGAPILPPLTLHDIPSIVEKEVKKEESIIFEKTTGVFSTIPEIVVRPVQEPIINYVEPELTSSDLFVIPEAPVLPTHSANDIHVLDEVKIEEPIVVDVEPNPVIQQFVIPEAPILPSLSLKSIPTFFEEKLKKEESIIFEEPRGELSMIPEIVVRPIEEPTVNYFKQEPTTADVLVIPEAPVLPKLLVNDTQVLEEVKIEEPIDFEVKPAIATQELVIPEAPILPPLSFIPSGIEEEVKKEELFIIDAETGELPSTPEISARPFTEPIILSETAEAFALENNVFPVAKEEVKIEVPLLLEETIDILPPIAEISSGRTVEFIQEPKMTNSYMLKEDSQPNPERVVTIKEILHPTIIPTPSNNLGVFSYAPFNSHLSNRVPKTNKLPIAKPASLYRFLHKKRPYFRLPVTPFPKHSLNEMKVPIWGNKNQFLHPTSYAHYTRENGIAPSNFFKKNAPRKRVKSYTRSQVPKRPSYL